MTLILLAGCAGSPGQVTRQSYPPVPAPLADPMPKPPVTPEPLLWQPGHWDWTGAGYAWQPGQYVPAAGHGSTWQSGWWNFVGGEWRWEPAHWLGP